jgi:hypothetical protein
MSNNDNIPPELLEKMDQEGWSPKEVEEYLVMTDDIIALGTQRWQLLRSKLEGYLNDD